MKIRTQLAWLVAAVVVPVALLAAAMTWQLWRLQRDAQAERFLERVSALRLAVDTQLDGHVRVLRVLGESTVIEGSGESPLLAGEFSRLLANNPAWAAIGWCDGDGRLIAGKDRDGGAVAPPQHPRGSGAAATFSDLVPLADGRFVTYVSIPVLRNGSERGALFVMLSNAGWLDFLNTYPIATGATLTMVDSHSTVIVRTLNNERSVGKPASRSFQTAATGRDEGVTLGPGLEGQRFYSAFSRLRTSGWVLGTGVPSESVEAELRTSTIWIGVGVVLTALLVALFATRIGSRIIGSMSGLTHAAVDIADPRKRPPDTPLAIDEAETVRRALATARDLLATREAEREAAFAREAEARAGAERTNAAKDEFIAMLGHELRNPLSAMRSASTLLANPALPAEVAARSKAVIERQITRLTDLVNDLLDAARVDSGRIVLQRQPLDLADIVRHVVASFTDSGRCRHVAVELELAAAPVSGDETRLEQVVANLFDNACRYTPTDGRIGVETGVHDGKATLVVADDGSGIAAELLPRVFDVFAQGARTLERAEGGLGLGLTVVQRLVMLHGGEITVASEGPGHGTRFTVTLPLATAVPAGSPVIEVAPPAVAPLSIVVVEDNPDMRDAYRMLLADAGHRANVIVDGEAGAAAIIERAPDVAIVDIGLPGIDGFEVARRVRAAGKANPAAKRPMLVAVTGYGAPADRERALAAGFDAFLVKPFDLETFERLVRAPADLTTARSRA